MAYNAALVKVQATIRMFLTRRLYKSVFEEFSFTVAEIRQLMPSRKASLKNPPLRPPTSEFDGYSIIDLLEEEKKLECLILERLRILQAH